MAGCREGSIARVGAWKGRCRCLRKEGSGTVGASRRERLAFDWSTGVLGPVYDVERSRGHGCQFRRVWTSTRDEIIRIHAR